MTRGFASHGASLVLADIDIDGVRELARETGGGASWHGYDQGDSESVEKLADAAGPVDVLINNAGILLFKSLADSGSQEIQRLIDVNVVGVIVLARSVARGMCARRRGVIVNMGSQ